jgi:hypothetical protein
MDGYEECRAGLVCTDCGAAVPRLGDWPTVHRQWHARLAAALAAIEGGDDGERAA